MTGNGSDPGNIDHSNAASGPLFRDPIYDGAADPTLIFNPHEQAWWMIYTNRPTTMPGATGLQWLFGSDLGVASSTDGGATWTYRGVVAGLNFDWGRNTFWAPEIFEQAGVFHMYCSYIQGIPAPSAQPEMRIHHYVSNDLVTWTHVGPLRLHSDQVIDACLIEKPDGGFRMWYKDGHDSSTWVADSSDLYSWTTLGCALRSDSGHEGPNVFWFAGHYWLIVDTWAGQLVHRSSDLDEWTPAGTILAGPHGEVHGRTDDVGPGLHADVVVSAGRAWIFYFTHPDRSDRDHPTIKSRRSSIHVAELKVTEGRLSCNRDSRAVPQLSPP